MKQTDILNEIKMRLDIIDVISEYVNLKRSGANYKGLCPFHPEKTPSFTVSPSKQFYYCFGCGEGGDVISFIRKIENLTFQETLERLARKAGIEYRPQLIKVYSKHSLVLSILKEAMEFYKENLKKQRSALEYLILKRGISEESIERFSLGYAPKAWDSLMLYLKARGFNEAMMKEAGVLSYSEKGSYDLFRDRIIFPIRNLQGEVIGFGGRVMDDTLPKYINSPETILFKKGENLYGLFEAKEGIKREGYAIITEGYMDVIMCHQKGFTNVIAPLGTALTEKQIMVLRRLTDKIILLYDGDSAGISAAKRAIPLLLEQSIKPLIVLLPEGDDPDTFLRRESLPPEALHSPQAELRSLLERPLGLIEFYKRVSGNLKDINLLRELTGIISRIEDPLLKGEYIRDLSEETGFKEEFLIEEIKRIKKKGVTPSKVKGGTESLRQEKGRKIRHPEELLIAVILQYPEKRELVFENLNPDDIVDPVLKRLYAILVEKWNEAKSVEDPSRADSLMHEIVNHLLQEDSQDDTFLIGGERDNSGEGAVHPDLKNIVADLSFNIHFDEEGLERVIKDCLKKIKIRTIDRLINEARSRNDLILINSLVKEKAKIQFMVK
jgi:DNA primase